MGTRIARDRAVFSAAVALTVTGALTERKALQWIAKPLIAPTLAAQVWRARERTAPVDTALLLGGLTAATVGDVLLIEPDDDRRLVAGATAFAAMQLGYAALLHRAGARPTAPAALPRVTGAIAAAGLLGARARHLAAPLTAYGLTLGTATTLASDPALVPDARAVAGLVVPGRRPASRLGLGALLFTLSDGLIVVRRTLLRGSTSRRVAEGAILASYAAAQALLVEGMLDIAEMPGPIGIE
ncbi:lysoplasmalogenase [Aldersonia sp. NBC_00410]|uniref:lysoplasmalogenase n=1 Tax=Aldersonia sp. NBC_00410 TaxID=2975954 RepID=UPI002259D54F|nr:lysoplasmalogenase [Aldersonia sp. NBC_00410]MCX5042004.1 lysoplasmalogenase [Aldersonia sp. NBC_00410]